ncbi:pLS20_p028 family conjugation system transmembrane protein [Bacillus altitudinis]|uniref:pLS20_p028 family conjugation system transmembrane protein n=2 Tax=Bacillus TaxID=1386 RepID=UPI002943B8D3|nr:hypothetical protein [Bacillus altitudinis]WOI43338.1 hypothetical protein RZ534_20045 [Bacillus altitudinis]
MTEEEIIKILIRFHEYLSLSNVFIAILRTVGWYFLIGLAECVDALSGGVSSIYELINFFDSPAIDDFLTKYMPVIFSMAALALGFLGWKIIIKKQTDYSKIITSSIVALTIFLVLPWGMQKASELVSLGRESLESENLTVSTKIFQNNITDVYKIDQAGWSLKELDKMTRKNNIRDKTDVHFVDINEVVDTGGLWKKSPLTEDGKAILTKKVSDASGKRTLEDLQSRWISEDEAYNRYSWHPWYIFFELVTVGIVLFMTMFRTAQMIMELGILKIFSMGTAFTDLESGQRNKRIIEKIRNTFIVMFAMVLILECFIIFTDFVGQSSLNGAVKIVALFAAGILTIDGPAFIDEIFGIDVGVKSIGRSLLGAFALGRSAKGAASFAGGLASKAAKTGMKIGKKTAGGALTTAGATKGLLDGYKEKGKQQGTSSAPGGASPLSKTKATAPYNVLNSDKLKEALNGEETGQNGSQGKLGGEETPLGGDGSQGKLGGEETPLGGDGSQGKLGGEETPLGGDGAPGKPGAGETPLGGDGAPGKPGGEETPLGGDGAPGKPGGEETPLGGDGAPGKPGAGETPLGGDGAPGKPGAGETPLGGDGAPGKPGAGETLLGGDGAPGKPGAGETPLGGDGSPGKPGAGETPLGGSAPLNAAPRSNSGSSSAPLNAASRSNSGSSSAPLNAAPRSNSGSSSAPLNTAPRSNSGGGSAPLNAAPRSNSGGGSAPLNAAPRSNSGGGSAPLNAAPRSNSGGGSAPLNAAPRSNSGGGSAPLNAAPRSNSGGGSAPLNTAPRSNSGSSSAPLNAGGHISKNNITLPKHANIARVKLKDHIKGQPTTTDTVKDVVVNKYANLAEKAHNSKPIKNARKAYDVAKNTVLDERNDNQ